ncbi:RagB/SusD family nutrient uptake outer membrane protein [Flammeovirgaceae bacterium SG7u.111]|nr:RagB/SusD family nutrient uptake outer membrane protein [Flammeovirgaceae bacterium SG7u.132]WPO35023.1 RagB/SusD family nutrient uptake outer membrane protein [Flammeovirgaceae bacterium SG7u.111]
MKKILIIFIATLLLVACNDSVLDLEPKDRIADTAVWTDASLIRAYHNAIYSSIEDAVGPNMMAKATDEMCFNQTNRYPGVILNNTLNSDNVDDRANFRGGGSVYTWNRDYDVIRKILVFLDEMEGNEVLDNDEKTSLIAEARVIRAFMYFRLMVRYGGVPIIDKVYALDDEFSFPRNTMDECAAYVEADIAAAMPDLPEAIFASDGDFGKVNQSVAKALLSRFYLYMASPLFNESNDQSKWQKAADAALDLIDDGNYSLHPDYTTLFNAPSGTANNELIWARNYTASNAHDLPMYMMGRRWGAYGGWGGAGGVSQNLVDDYEMTNGELPFIKENHVNTATINPASGYDPQNPYANRDPRFYQSVTFDGTELRDVIMEKWISSDGATWGFDSYKQSGDNPRSNYTLRKFMPGTDVMPDMGWSQNYVSPYIRFRLGEVYLNYAEAMFELGDEATCREYLNMIRARPTVEMPAIPATVTGEELRTKLYNERRVELAFEEHRYFDVRRWKIAPYTEVVNLHGIDIVKDVDTGVKTYTPVSLFERAWDDRLYFIPIAIEEIQKANGDATDGELTQTPGY